MSLESQRAASLRWKQKNKEKVAAYQREWRARTPEYQRAYYEKTKDKRREEARRYRSEHADECRTRYTNWRLKSTYGLTIENRQELFAAQGFVCAACGTDKPGRSTGFGWDIDHCHTTGKVRGIICLPCNVALGKVRDNPEHLQKLITYLERHSVKD